MYLCLAWKINVLGVEFESKLQWNEQISKTIGKLRHECKAKQSMIKKHYHWATLTPDSKSSLNISPQMSLKNNRRVS